MSSSPTTSDVGNIGEIAILLVEDNLVNQKVIQKMISRLGLKKDDLADNGLIATEMVQKNNYDLILMDVRMPSWMVWRQLDGSECITKTADVLTENRNEGLNSGMDRYLSKPVSKSKLQEVINEVYRNRI
ncbi:CheY-like superfamily [Paraphysoderma sedebokerense]|nr:CheY-like superfamily [Paraphysoderma sedebokerense]